MTRRLRSLVLALAVTACVDSPTEFVANANIAGDPLALTFDELARQAAVVGDGQRSAGFTLAALSIRNGVTPGRLDLRNDGVLESYDAFVHSVTWLVDPGAKPFVSDHRAITAWRRTSDGITRILAFTTQGDSAAIVPPLAPVAAGLPVATGWFEETASIVVTSNATASTPNVPTPDRFWVATSGFVRVRETVLGGACGATAVAGPIVGVTCQQAKYAVRLDAAMYPLAARPFTFLATGAVRRVQAPGADQVVNGFRLAVSCVNPSASRGCG